MEARQAIHDGEDHRASVPQRALRNATGGGDWRTGKARGILALALCVASMACWATESSDGHLGGGGGGGGGGFGISQMGTNDAVRLLEQATFGPTDALVTQVKAEGLAVWLNSQFSAPESHYPAYPWVPQNSTTYCASSTDTQCYRDNYTLFYLQNAFFQNALNNPDQLRQRVAFALSQIFVTSGLVIGEAYAMAGYQQIMLDNAFGNFETLLTQVTLSPVMGNYLNMANNVKQTGAVAPNENYGREILQLFSIGVWELNSDGSLLLDRHGQPIPSYDQDTVEGFSHVFTGWTYPVIVGATPGTRTNPQNYLSPMIGIPGQHDATSQTLLNDATTTANVDMTTDLTFAIHNIFMHPNVGPFIGKQLIQKLVTSNPSPAYISRVAAAFNNDGKGVRGNLKAVVTAILSDAEARGASKTDAAYGKLREPVLYLTGMARAVGTTSDGVYFPGQSNTLGQNLFYPPTVFNYYSPDYVIPDANIVGPEFQLQNAGTAIARYNIANTFTFGTIGPLSSLPGATGTQPNWTALQKLAASPKNLIAELNTLLLHGTMSAAMQATILTAVNAVAATDTLTRAKTAFYLTVTSPEYQVEQ